MGIFYLDKSAWLIPPVPNEFHDIFNENCQKISVTRGHKFKIGHSFIYLADGLLCQGFLSGALNKTHFISLTVPGRAVGYMQFIGSQSHVEYVKALRNSEVMILPFEKLETYLKKDYELHRLIIKYCSDCIESDVEGFQQLFTESAATRLKVLLKGIFKAFGITITVGWNKLPLKLTHKEYSQVVFTTLKTIDCLLPQWKKDGLYRSNKDGVWIHGSLFDDDEFLGKIWQEDPKSL